MKVLFVSAVPDLRGGAEQVLLDLLANPKVEPVLALPGPGPLDTIAARLNCPAIHFDAGSVLDVHRPLQWAAAVRAIPDMFRSASQLRAAARKHGCTIIHSNGLKVHIISLVATAFCRDLRTVVHLHDISYSAGERMMWRLLGRFADRLVVVSKPCWPDSALAPNVRIIPNGVGPQLMAPARAARTEIFRLGYVGRFHRHKGLLLLVDWLAAARDAGLEFRFHFRGGVDPDNPQYWQSVERKLAAANLLDRIQVDGWRSGPAVYDGLDAVVVPSDCPDPMPKVVLEAGAQGLPVIAQPSGGIPSMIEDRRTGFLVSDTQAFVDVVTKLIRDPRLCAKIGTAAQRHIASEFTLHRFHERFDTLYAELDVSCDSPVGAHDRKII
jgi:glycosyltransferase involved in cell wall biosynthesis